MDNLINIKISCAGSKGSWEFAQARLSLLHSSEISCADSNNDLCIVYKNSECCGEAAPATIAHLGIDFFTFYATTCAENATTSAFTLTSVPVHLHTHLLTHIYIPTPIYPFTHTITHPSTHPSISSSFYPHTQPVTHPSIHTLIIYPSAHPSIQNHTHTHTHLSVFTHAHTPIHSTHSSIHQHTH